MQNWQTVLKNLWQSSHTTALSKGTILAKKNAVFFSKINAGISKIRKVLALKSIFSETTYACVFK